MPVPQLPAPKTQAVSNDDNSISISEDMVATLNLHTNLLVGSQVFLAKIASGVTTMKDAIEDSFKGSNLDSGTVQGNVKKKEDDGLAAKFGSMLDSMTEAFGNLSTTKKSLLGIGALIAALAVMNAYSEELVEFLAPILKFIKEKLIPGLKELNAIILDAPGGYWTLLSGIGLSTALWGFFGVGGKIASLFTKVTNAILGIKAVEIVDDLDVRKVTWGSKIRVAFMGRLTGLFGRIGGIFTSIGTSIRAMGTTIIDDVARGLKALTPQWATALKRVVFGGDTIYPIVKGGGKTVGLVGKVSQSIEKVVTSIKNLNPFKGLAASLKTLGASWKLAISTAMFGQATVYPIRAGGGAKLGVIGKITNAITKIALIIKGIFSPASILGRFTSKIKGIFAIIGKALGFVSKMTGLTQFLKLGLSLGRAIPIVGQVIMVLMGIFSFIKGAIEGFKTGGILGAIKGGLIGLYDGLVGSFLNLIADIIGWVFKKLGFEKVGEFFSNLDFSFDSIMNGIMWVVDKIKGAFHMVVNGLKRMANGVIKAINFVLPGRFEIDEFEITPYKSTYEPRTTTASAKMDVSDMPTITENTTRATTSNVDIAALQAGATSDMQNQDIKVSPVFADIDQDTGVTDAEAQAMVAAMQKEPSAADIAADEAKLNALVEAEMKRLELAAEAEIARTGGEVTVYDTSSRSTLNNATHVSNALSVDASDLVAAKLNLMLPAFN